MAEEKTGGFSAEKFLDSYPDASTPRSNKTRKMRDTPVSDTPEPLPKKEIEPHKLQEARHTYIQASQTEEFSEQERQYLSEFVTERVPVRFSKTGKQVAISQNFHNKIMRIITIFGNGDITIGGYLDNIIRKHFEEFTPLIQSMLDQRNKF